MKEGQLTQLAEKYRTQIVVRRDEFMLPPNAALHLVRELADLGILILGGDGWCYVDRDKGWIRQELGISVSADEHIPWEEMTPEKNAAIIEHYLRYELPPDIELFSLELNDAEVQELFTIEDGPT